METEKRISRPDTLRGEVVFTPGPPQDRGLRWAFLGDQGLRAGWSLLVAMILYHLWMPILGTMAVTLDPSIAKFDFSASSALIEELIPLLAALMAGVLVARIEQRRVLDYNLTGPRVFAHFFSGLAMGFAALSALVGALAWGGWLRFGPVALTGMGIFKFAALWAVAFVFTGLYEEGVFRGYLQFTLTRGINFWCALGATAVLCLDLQLRSLGYPGILAFFWLNALPTVSCNGAWGVYFSALLGVAPCFWLHWKKARGANFWQAAWVTSTFFGFVHTGNGGENWIGIFAAAAIGFIFCVSIRLTGSAWWAIGCHASWDWAETYFYGTADSGLVAQGHYFRTRPAGTAIWSGGADGPEGSLLVLGILVLLLAALLGMYGRKGKPAIVSEQQSL